MRRRRALLLGAVALGLSVLALGVLSLGLVPQEPLRRWAERRLRSALGPEARLGRLHVVPATLRIEVWDLVLPGPGYRLEVPRLRVVLSPATLGGSVLALRALEVERPRLVLGPAAGPPRPAPASPPGTVSPPLRIASLRVIDGRVEYTDGEVGRLTLEGVGARGSLGEGTIEVEAEGGAWERDPPLVLGPARARLRVSPRLETEVEFLEAGTAGSRLRLAGTLGRPGRFSPDLRFDGQIDLLGGRASGEARLSGSSVRGRVRIAGLALDRLRREGFLGRPPLAGEASGTLDFTGDLGGAVRVAASVGADGRLADGSFLRLEAGSGGVVWPAERRVDLTWTAGVEAAAAPRLAALGVRARGAARGALPPDVDGRFAGTAEVRSPSGPEEVALQGALRVRGARARLDLEASGFGGATLKASAEARDGAMSRLTLGVESLPLAAFVADAQGTASFEARVGGDLRRPSGAGTIRVESLAFRGVEIGSATLEAKAERGPIDLVLDVPALHAHGEARVRLGARPDLRGRLSLAATPLAPLAPLLPEGSDLAGALSATVEGALDLARPEEAEVEARVERIEVISGGLAAAAGPFTLGLRQRRLEVDGLDLQGPGIEAQVSGRLGLDRSTALDLRSTIRVDLERVPPPEGWRLAGQLSADVALVGTAVRPRATGPIRLSGVSVEGPSLPAVSIAEGRVDLEGDAATLDLTVSAAGGSLRLSGRLPFAALLPSMRAQPGPPGPGEAAALRLAWDGLEAGALLTRLLPERPPAVAGALGGELTLEGGFASLEELRARLDVPASRFQVQDVSLASSPLAVRLDSGRVEVDTLELSAAGGSVRVGGRADLRQRTLDVTGRGRLDLRVLSPLLAEASLSGAGDLDVSVRGTFDAPETSGRLQVSDGTLRLRALPQALTALEGTVVFDGRTVRLEDGSAALGGGTLAMSGTAMITGRSPSDVRLALTGRDLSLRYPEGLRSALEADLLLEGEPGALRLSGTVSALRGLYDLDVAFQAGLGAVTAPAASPLLRSVALDVRVAIANPIRVRNNLGRLEVTGSLALRGDAESPAPFGRVNLAPGGTLLFQGREFRVDSGSLVYDGTWDAALDLRATNRIAGVDALGRTSDYEVTVALGGRLESPSLRLSATPELSGPEIVSLIATGRTGGGQALTSTAYLAGEQVAALLASRLTGSVAGGLRELGIDEVTIQPELLARETDPGARFTFRKQVSRFVSLLYSLSLNNPENRFIRLEGEPGRDVRLKVQREDDGTLTYGAGQSLRFGGAAASRPRLPQEKVRLAAVRFEAPPATPEDHLEGAVRARAGRGATIWDLQDDADRLRERLIDRGHIEAEVGVRLEERTAVFLVRPGPRYVWSVEGMHDPPDLGKTIREALYEEEALDRGRRRLLRELRGRGHLRASVRARAVGTDAERTLVFAAEPGPRLAGAVLEFPGAEALSPSRLGRAAGGVGEILTSPEPALERIRAAYRDAYHLSAEVDRPRVTEERGRVRVVVPVREGPRARLVELAFPGATRPEDELRRAAGLEVGAPFEQSRVEAAVLRLRDHYLILGHPAVRVSPELEPRGSDVRLLLRVTEGERVVVGSIEVRGLVRTRESLVRGQVDLRPGDAGDPRRLAQIERRLLDLGVFSRASVSVRRSESASGESPAILIVEVEERPPFSVGYDARYNDDTGGEGLVDAAVDNLFGRALSVGGRYRLSSDKREARGSLHLPSLGRAGDLTVSAFRLEEEVPNDPSAVNAVENTQVQQGVRLQQTLGLGNRWNLLYGYTFRRVKVVPAFPDPIDVASIEGSLLRDTRDNPLDARRGRFLSLNFELSPKQIGSDFTFVKGLAQAFVVRGLSEHFTWAQGYRLGLAHGFGGQRLISSDRFKAGGGNTVRGFASDSLGPVFLDDPAGGQAVVVFNQELRYHAPHGLGAAAFYDAGDVFESVSDLSLDLRHSLGLGLRWTSPVGLLRVDLGFPLNRRLTDKAYRVFFSLGQAF